jgi:ATP-dependent DNA helicase RecG
MRPREKAEAMEAFNADPPTRADVLVATTVIEVGIDVPNATVMLVEDAERYGISQLHQLRGRVGRGSDPSLCLLFGPAESLRLQALARNTDGFELAQIDLELRGEGELTGTRQSGLARFDFARLPEDAAILERAHQRAALLLHDDPGLAAPELALLAERVDEREGEPVAA